VLLFNISTGINELVDAVELLGIDAKDARHLLKGDGIT
jgi:hypothetical protein